MKMKTMHYSGRMKIVRAKSTSLILPGWACCCSGERSEELRANGHVTREKSFVTCKRCLRNIADELTVFEKYPEAFDGDSDWNAGFKRWKEAQR
jgi:hypothetical protein